MIDFRSVSALALAEMRLTRRLVRFWVFFVLATLVAAVMFAQYAVLHRQFSSWSGSASSINPRYLIAAVGTYYIYMFLFGLVFLAFDVRARDRRERMWEVLDSRPYSNLDLILGRCLGQLALGWLAMSFICLLMALVGYLIGTPIELWSLIGLTVFMAIPAFTFAIALTFVITLLVRFRLVAAVIAIAALLGLFAAMLFGSIVEVPWFDVTGGYHMDFPSELLPGIADWEGWLQRLGVMLASLGLLMLAAALYPRLDQTPLSVRAGTGAALLAAGILALGSVVMARAGDAERFRSWRAAHEEAAPGVIPPDLERVSGRVEIEPGRRLHVELEVAFRAPPGHTLDEAVFTLNPGLGIVRLADADGNDVPFRMEQGLLRARLPEQLTSSEASSLRIEYEGIPDPGFHYLDGVIELFEVTIREAQVFILGYDAGIFDRRYVALMPGTHWLPHPGAGAGRAVEQFGQRDPYRVDLTVAAPEGWSVAGPGTAEPAGAGEWVFAPDAPVTEVALIAAEFASREMEVAGTRFRMLLYPGHAGLYETLAPMKPELEERLAERLSDASDAGLAYPYGSLTLVEVPVTLRGFGGGWRMASSLSAPGILMVRESGLPTARFDVPFRDPDRFKDREGGLPRAMLERVEKFFSYDFSGGNVIVAADRNFFHYQAAARGRGAVALDFFTEQLVSGLVSKGRGYFTALSFDADLNGSIGQVIGEVVTARDDDADFVDAMIRVNTSRGEVWRAALDTSLSDLDPWEAPKNVFDLLVLKTEPMADSFVEQLGYSETVEMTARLLESGRGGWFTRADIVAAAGEEAGRCDRLLSLWLDETALPGFVVSRAESYRLRDNDDGTARYQLLLTVRNDESVPGLMKVRYQTGREQNRRFDETDPIEIEGRSAVRIGVVSSTPFGDVQVVPFLSLNRSPFSTTIPPLDEEEQIDTDPVRGASRVEWTGPELRYVVVDDLDSGFAVSSPESGGVFRFRQAPDAEGSESGELPDVRFGNTPREWSRVANPAAWGHYRHTAAVLMSSGADAAATFKAELPEPGRYRLEVFVPRRFSVGVPVPLGRGDWELTVVDDGGDRRQTIDADEAPPGWNVVGEYELPAGAVSVRLNSDEAGGLLVADAIRWSPLPAATGQTR